MVTIPNDLERGEPVLVSACVAGEFVRYNGESKEDSDLLNALQNAGAKIIPVCPEVLGGLSVPRPPAEPSRGGGKAVWRGEARVMTDSGKDVTAQFLNGAHSVLGKALDMGVRYAFLKERSPSCGVRQTHSGGKLVSAPGVTTAALQEAGIIVFPAGG